MIMHKSQVVFKLKVLILALHAKAKWILVLFKLNPKVNLH